MLSLTDKLLLTWFCQKRGLKVLWGEHESLKNGKGEWRKWLRKNPFLRIYRSLSRFATVVTVSHLLEGQFRQMGGVQHLLTIEGAIGNMNKSEDDWSPPHSEKFVIGTAGRLKAEKGIFQLLDAAAVFKNRKDVQFDIYGEGPMEDEFRVEILLRGLQDIVFLRGKVRPDRMEKVYETFDVAIFLSLETESFGLAPLEAMSCGVPAIITNHFGFLESAEHHPFLVVDPHGTHKVIELISALMQDEKYRESTAEAQRNYVHERFSEQKMIDQYVELIGGNQQIPATLF